MKSVLIIEGSTAIFFYFPANVFLNPKTICTPGGTIPQNFCLLELAVSEELGNKQTHSLTSNCFYRLISGFATTKL